MLVHEMTKPGFVHHNVPCCSSCPQYMLGHQELEHVLQAGLQAKQTCTFPTSPPHPLEPHYAQALAQKCRCNEAAAAGLCCAVNDAANEMVPPALRSNRPESLFHCMKVESSGTASYTLFAALGGPPKLTAFHQETKKRRSFNLGCGDFIIQPLATAESIRHGLINLLLLKCMSLLRGGGSSVTSWCCSCAQEASASYFSCQLSATFSEILLPSSSNTCF